MGSVGMPIAIEFVLVSHCGIEESLPHEVVLERDTWGCFASHLSSIVLGRAHEHVPHFNGNAVDVWRSSPSHYVRDPKGGGDFLQVVSPPPLNEFFSPSSRSSSQSSVQLDVLPAGRFIRYPGSFTSSEMRAGSLHASDAGRSGTLAQRIVLATARPIEVELPEDIARAFNLVPIVFHNSGANDNADLNAHIDDSDVNADPNESVADAGANADLNAYVAGYGAKADLNAYIADSGANANTDLNAYVAANTFAPSHEDGETLFYGTLAPSCEDVKALFYAAECDVFDCAVLNNDYQATFVDDKGSHRTIMARSDFALVPAGCELPPTASRDYFAWKALAWIEVSSGRKSMRRASKHLAKVLKCVYGAYRYDVLFGIVLSSDFGVARLIRMVSGVAEHHGYYPAAATRSLVGEIQAWQEARRSSGSRSVDSRCESI